MLTGELITNAKALRDTYVPQDLVHRHGKLEQLSAAVSPVTDGRPAENVTMYGPSGVGKTTLARYTLEQLEREAFGFSWGYANCMSHASRVSALFELGSARLSRDAW